MNRLCPLISMLLVFAATWDAASRAWGDTAVFANRTGKKVSFVLAAPEPAGHPAESHAEAHQYQIMPGDVLPVRVTRRSVVSFQSGDDQRQGVVEPNAIYFFSFAAGRLELQQIGLGSDERAAPAGVEPLPRAAPLRVESGSAQKPPSVAVIPVKILVDEDEPATTKVWEKRLRSRIEAASQIFERTCFVRFRVVAVDTWRSDNEIRDFHRSLEEFERKVSAAPARLAIGFTSQYHVTLGRTHLGGTRGPLHSHLLIREWSNKISESERLEVLLHELGHFLGSVHSPEADSVMRPVLGDRQSRAAAFRIGFDPVNTLAMCLVGEELRERPTASLAGFSLQRQLLLHQIYAEMVRSMPDDPTAARYMKFVERARLGPLVQGSKQVVQAVVEAAGQNARLPVAREGGTAGRARTAGDELTNLYFRRAAAAAQELPSEIATSAFLVGLGIALDTSDLLRKNSVTGRFCRAIETDEERRARLAVIGLPTARDRHDLVEHFAVSAGLCALIGPAATETVGLLKERQDAQLTSGFSFADYQADMAGIVFVARLRESQITLAGLAAGFTVERFLPAQDELPERLSWNDFTVHYGSFADGRFQKVRTAIGQRIADLSSKHDSQGKKSPE